MALSINMPLSGVYKWLHSVFILHGAVSIVISNTFILKVDFKKVVHAKCDFSGFYWSVTQSWLIAYNQVLSLLCMNLDCLWLIFLQSAFCESKCCSVTVEICQTGDLYFWITARKTNHLTQKKKHFWKFCCEIWWWFMICHPESSSWGQKPLKPLQVTDLVVVYIFWFNCTG